MKRLLYFLFPFFLLPYVATAQFNREFDTLKIKRLYISALGTDTSKKMLVLRADGRIAWSTATEQIDTVNKVETRYHAGQTFQPIGSYAPLDSLPFMINGSTIVQRDTDKYVGIGKHNPSVPLDIEGNVNFNSLKERLVINLQSESTEGALITVADTSTSMLFQKNRGIEATTIADQPINYSTYRFQPESFSIERHIGSGTSQFNIDFETTAWADDQIITSLFPYIDGDGILGLPNQRWQWLYTHNIDVDSNIYASKLPFSTSTGKRILVHDSATGLVQRSYMPTSFPGFGTSHSTAAYGDHNHTGVYQPVGSYLTAESDPYSFHKADSNTNANPITLKYFNDNKGSTYSAGYGLSLAGSTFKADTAKLVTFNDTIDNTGRIATKYELWDRYTTFLQTEILPPYSLKSDSSINGGYAAYYTTQNSLLARWLKTDTTGTGKLATYWWTTNQLSGKQATLVSGSNIKTINGSSILGAGDLTVSSMTYPAAGLAKSTGSAWTTSVTDNSSQWNDAYTMWGYINRYGWTIASRNAITLSFNPTDSTLTLTNPGTAVYLRGGRICSFTGNKTAKIGVSSPVAKAKWYFYISDDNGTLSATTTPWTLTEEYTGVPVAAVDWDHYGTPWKYWMQNELHQCVIDRETHKLNHKLIGSRLGVGGTISGYTASGTPTLARNTFQIDASTLIDEDLEHTLNRRSDPTTYGRNYIVFYRNASTSVWKSDTSSVPYRYTSGSYIQYDNAGTMTTGANTTFYNTYLLYTNLNDSARFVIIHGRAGFASITAAQAENPLTFDFTGFSPEAVIAWQLTWETSNAYTGVVGKCRLATAPRQLSIALSTTGSTTATATTPPIWTAVTGTRTGAATFTFSGTATDALKCTKSLFQALKSDGTVGRYGYIKSASESGGTITATVVSTSALEANDYEFYIAYGEKVQGLDNNYRWTNEVPGTIVADASNYQGKYYLNTPDTMYFVSSQPDVITAASGTGAAATYNIYAGASALYSTAPDMGTAATLTDQVPATLQKINPGVNVTLRWLTSAGATTKCADASVKITWIPSSIIRAK